METITPDSLIPIAWIGSILLTLAGIAYWFACFLALSLDRIGLRELREIDQTGEGEEHLRAQTNSIGRIEQDIRSDLIQITGAKVAFLVGASMLGTLALLSAFGLSL